MKIKSLPEKSVIVLFLLVTLGCANRQTVVKDTTGREIPLPQCKEYLNKFKSIKFDINILDKYKTSLDISSEYKTSLENIQQHYVLQIENLCSQAGTYFAAGKGDEWFCRAERLSNSAMQLEYTNRILEGIKNKEDAQNQSAIIKKYIDDYMDRFFKQFDMPCSSPPKPLTKPKLIPTTAELEKDLRDELWFLRRSTEYFDQGMENEGKRIAGSLHKLFVDMEDSFSLLELMRIRDKLRLPDTAHEDVKGNQAAYMGLLSGIISTNRVGFIANCLKPTYDGSTAKSLPFADWWGKVVLDNREGLVFTRESLVKAVAEEGGGLRVAPGLDPKYVELAVKSGMGWRTVIQRKTDKGWQTVTDEPVLGVELHSLRQIAWEVLDAMSRQYPQYFPKAEVSLPDRSTPLTFSFDSIIVQ